VRAAAARVQHHRAGRVPGRGLGGMAGAGFHAGLLAGKCAA
jgi:hypothetical protein